MIIFPEEFVINWLAILSDASRGNLVLKVTRIAVEFIERNIVDLQRTTKRDFGFLVKVRFLEKIKNIIGRLQDSLTKRSGKFHKVQKKIHVERQTLRHYSSRRITANPSPDRIQVPSRSQVGGFIAGIQSEMNYTGHSVLIESVGPEESLNGVNPLPVDSPLLLLDLTNTRGTTILSSNLEGEFIPRGAVSIPIATLTDTVREEVKLVMRPASKSDDFRLGSLNTEVYTGGLQLVTNLKSRQLTVAEKSLPSKGLLCCPTPSEIDVYASRKDVLDFVGRITLKEYVYSDDVIDGTPDFRKKPIWCPDRNREFNSRGVRK